MAVKGKAIGESGYLFFRKTRIGKLPGQVKYLYTSMLKSKNVGYYLHRRILTFVIIFIFPTLNLTF